MAGMRVPTFITAGSRTMIALCIAVVLCVAVLIGSCAAWVSPGPDNGGLDVPGRSIPGYFFLVHSTIGLNEGVATLLISILAGIMVGLSLFVPTAWRRLLVVTSLVCLLLAAAVGITAWIEIGRLSGVANSVFETGYSTGPGVIMVTVCGLLAVVAATVALVLDNESAGPSPLFRPVFGGVASSPDVVPANYGLAAYPQTGYGVAGRIALLDSGRPLPEIPTMPNVPITIGRDRTADVRLSDPTVGRLQVRVTMQGGTWVVEDLSHTNTTVVLGPGGARQGLNGGRLQVPSAQLAVGNSIITLFPMQ